MQGCGSVFMKLRRPDCPVYWFSHGIDWGFFYRYKGLPRTFIGRPWAIGGHRCLQEKYY